MKLGSCQYQEQIYVFVVDGRQLLLPALHPDLDLPHYRDMRLCLARGGVAASDLRRLDHRQHLEPSDVTLLAPIPRPAKNLMCLGWK